jgi:hypothetical protein
MRRSHREAYRPVAGSLALRESDPAAPAAGVSGSSTERVSLWKSKVRISDVFVAFSVYSRFALNLALRPENLDPIPASLHWIVATGAEGMATQQSARRHHTSLYGAISINRLDGILRTRGKESARRWKKWRDDQFVKPKKCD